MSTHSKSLKQNPSTSRSVSSLDLLSELAVKPPQPSALVETDPQDTNICNKEGGTEPRTGRLVFVDHRNEWIRTVSHQTPIYSSATSTHPNSLYKAATNMASRKFVIS